METRADDAPPIERKLAAILAADVEGYSRLMHADEERALRTLTGHRQIIDELILSRHGQVFATAGDSVLAEFPSVVEAFHAAIAIQQALTKANAELPDDERMPLRIGINVGDVILQNGDVLGDGVNIAARIEALSEPGGVCVSRAVRDQLRDRIDTKFEDLGEHSVKNIARPIRVFRACFDPHAEPELPTEKASVEPSEAPGNEAEQSGETPASTEIVFWQSVQAADDEAEYRIYLERYPEGAFADLAKARLAGTSAVDASGVELAFWDTVRDSGNADMVRAYLEKFPQGEFTSLAKILLAEIDDSSS